MEAQLVKEMPGGSGWHFEPNGMAFAACLRTLAESYDSGAGMAVRCFDTSLS